MLEMVISQLRILTNTKTDNMTAMNINQYIYREHSSLMCNPPFD